jgi:phosphoserine phosphatase RsbU/P
MCAPLIEPGGTKLGVIQVSTRDLGQQFTSEDLELLACVCSQCALAIQNAAMHETAIAQRDIERDLEFATQVQIGFLPNQPPAIPGYEFADYYEPAHRVGGDYFDYIRLPNGNVAVAVGDVAGKGVPAALLMARLHASARYHLLSALSADEALTSLNTEISTSGLGFRFITLALAVINPEKHEVHLANAGHLPPLLRGADGQVKSIGQRESGMPLGVMPQQNYRETVLPLAAGDTLVFYTDGVTEAMDDQQQVYGRVRLTDTLQRAPSAVRELVPFLVDDVENFFGERNQRDDLCVVAVRRSE